MSTIQGTNRIAIKEFKMIEFELKFIGGDGVVLQG
jgi:hypothetical protein